nr:hypothetical protein [Tanacetum cinerariifolium]
MYRVDDGEFIGGGSVLLLLPWCCMVVVRRRGWQRGEGGGGCGVVVAAVAGVVLWRVRESGIIDRVDRRLGILFGFAGKIPLEKFPAAAVWWPSAAAGGRLVGGGGSEEARFEKVQPVDDMDCYLLHTLNSMFEHHVEDSMWKNQQGLAKVKNYKIFYSCGVHCVSMQNTAYYLLVEKMYLLTNYTLTQMWNDVRLQVDYEVEMAYDLLRLVIR